MNYKHLQDVKTALENLNLDLPLSENIDILRKPVEHFPIPNRLAIQPMEAADGNPDGSPSELSIRRYHRYARGGAGLIWFEAVSIEPEARANPRQLMLTKENTDTYKRLLDDIREISQKENGYIPMIIIQSNHSGRYSKPAGKSAPIIAYNNPLYEKDSPIPKEHIITDDELKRLEESHAVSAKLSEAVGFDGFEVKACHRYITSELFSAYERSGDYGGCFVNRIRFFVNSIKAADAATNKMTITTRINLYDGFPHPYGWGVAKDGSITPDLTEPLHLIDILYNEYGLDLFNFTCGNPYVNPHVNRPFDKGSYESPEHPLEGVARMSSLIALVKREYPKLTVVSSAYSYLRHLSLYHAAGMIESGSADIAGYGRMAFAYPDFAKDILANGSMDKNKSCITCSKCTELMRAGTYSGCPVRDSDIYAPLYREHVIKQEIGSSKIT